MNKKSNDMILQKNNLMVKARYNLKSKENKVYLFILYQIQKQVKNIERELLTCVIKRSEFKDALPDVRDRGVKNIEKILSSLRSKPIYFMKLGEDGDDEWGEYGFIVSYKYKKKDDAFEIKMQSEVIDLLKEYMRGGYTPVNMVIMFSLEGYYAQRLYELIKLWSNTKNVIEYKLDTLKEYMMLDTKSSYNLYSNIKNKVIQPAVDELNESGFLNLTWEEVKNGRKVETLRFYIHDMNVGLLEDDSVINEYNFSPDDEEIFTKGVLRRIRIDFKYVDFENEYMKNAFDDAVMITMDKDDVDVIGAESYSLFKSILSKKIEDYKIIEEEEKQHKREMDLFW